MAERMVFSHDREKEPQFFFNDTKCRRENNEMPRLCADAVIAESKT